MNLEDLKRSMLIMNSHFRILPNFFLEDEPNVMFIALRLKFNAMDSFYQALEDDPNVILCYEDLLAKMTAAFTSAGALINAYLLLLRLEQDKDSMET